MSKQAIIESSKKLFLKYGIKSVSMDDIAKRLGMSKKTIYNHIPNKSCLIESVLKHFIKEERTTIKDITKNADNALDEMVSIARYVLSTMHKMKPTLTYDLKKYHSSSWNIVEKKHFAYIEDVIKSNLIRGKRENIYRENINEDIQAKLYIKMASSLMDEDNFPSSKYQKPTIYQHFFNYHVNGIVNDKGRKLLNKYLNN